MDKGKRSKRWKEAQGFFFKFLISEISKNWKATEFRSFLLCCESCHLFRAIQSLYFSSWMYEYYFTVIVGRAVVAFGHIL